ESLRVLAPLLGAGLFALVGGRAVVALDMATFLAAAAFTASLPLREPRPEPPRSHLVAELSEGLRFLLRSPLLRRMTLAAVVCTLVLGFSESTVWAVIGGLHRPATFVGVTQLCQGAGAIAGGLLCAALVRRLGEVP